MTTAYIVVSGEYSDYRVLAVYLDRNQADAAVDQANRHRGKYRSEFEVEERPLCEGPPKTVTLYSTRWFKSDRDLATVDSRVEIVWGDEEPQHQTHEDNFMVWAHGPDRERVVKSVADRRARLLAEREGQA